MGRAVASFTRMPRARGSARRTRGRAGSCGARVGHHADHLPVTGDRRFERAIERRHLAIAPDELREAARTRRVEPRAQRADALQLMDAQRRGDSLQLEVAEIAKLEVAFDQPRGMRGQVGRVSGGCLFHALREARPSALARCSPCASRRRCLPTTTSPEFRPMRVENPRPAFALQFSPHSGRISSRRCSAAKHARWA